MKIKKALSLLLTAIIALSVLSGCADKPTGSGDKNSVADYQNAKVGVMTASYQATIVDEFLPRQRSLNIIPVPICSMP